MPAIMYEDCDKADYQGGVRYTKNMTKQIVKVNYQGWVSDEGIVCFLVLVDKSKMLDCAYTVYNNSLLLVCPINTGKEAK